MAGAILERELMPTRRVRFDVATRSDDAEIRRLLRENPMPGRISVSLEREPDYFADAELPGEEKQTIVAREGRRLVCVGSCTIRLRFINGQARRVGYLGGLRLDGSVAGRFDILRRGYEFFRELQSEAPSDFYFTSIASDNARARKFLERGLPGLPHYEFVGEFVTLILCASRSSQNAAKTSTTELINHLDEHNRRYQLVPCWSAESLASLQPLGFGADHFHVVRNNGRVAACAALWDQRCFKQAVIRGYAPWLASIRPVLNVITRFIGNPRLPAPAEPLSSAFVSHLAAPTDDQETLFALIAKLRAAARQRGIELLTLGFAANDPRLATLRHNFRCREYHSRIYIVRWPELGGPASELDGRVLAPEVALL